MNNIITALKYNLLYSNKNNQASKGIKLVTILKTVTSEVRLIKFK